MGVRILMLGLKLQFTVALLSAVNPGTLSLMCRYSGEAIDPQKSEFIDLKSVAVMELSVVVGEGSFDIQDLLLH